MSDDGYDNDGDNFDGGDNYEEFDDEAEPNFSDNGSDAGDNNAVGDDQFVTSGDPAAAAAAAANGQGGRKTDDKRVPNDQRTTTPYMTKYERARLLGTRALQIRLVPAMPSVGGFEARRSNIGGGGGRMASGLHRRAWIANG